MPVDSISFDSGVHEDAGWERFWQDTHDVEHRTGLQEGLLSAR